MIKRYFTVIFFSALFGAERQPLPLLTELLLQRRAGIITPDQFMQQVADREVVQFMADTLSDEEKDTRYNAQVERRAFKAIEAKIEQIGQKILERPSSWPPVLRMVDFYDNSEFIKGNLCVYLCKNAHTELDSMLRYAVQEHQFNINSYVVSKGWSVQSRNGAMRQVLGTLLGMVALRGSVQRVALLLEMGASVTMPAANGELNLFSLEMTTAPNVLELIDGAGFGMEGNALRGQNFGQIRGLLQAAAARERAQTTGDGTCVLL